MFHTRHHNCAVSYFHDGSPFLFNDLLINRVGAGRHRVSSGDLGRPQVLLPARPWLAGRGRRAGGPRQQVGQLATPVLSHHAADCVISRHRVDTVLLCRPVNVRLRVRVDTFCTHHKHMSPLYLRCPLINSPPTSLLLALPTCSNHFEKQLYVTHRFVWKLLLPLQSISV